MQTPELSSSERGLGQEVALPKPAATQPLLGESRDGTPDDTVDKERRRVMKMGFLGLLGLATGAPLMGACRGAPRNSERSSRRPENSRPKATGAIARVEKGQEYPVTEEAREAILVFAKALYSVNAAYNSMETTTGTTTGNTVAGDRGYKFTNSSGGETTVVITEIGLRLEGRCDITGADGHVVAIHRFSISASPTMRDFAKSDKDGAVTLNSGDGGKLFLLPSAEIEVNYNDKGAGIRFDSDTNTFDTYGSKGDLAAVLDFFRKLTERLPKPEEKKKVDPF